MKKLLSLSALTLLIITASYSQVTIQSVYCENLTNPLGIDLKTPRFSWVLTSTGRNVSQSAYEIHVSKDASSLAKGEVWNSGKVQSDQSVFVAYGGPALASGEKYFWQIR